MCYNPDMKAVLKKFWEAIGLGGEALAAAERTLAAYPFLTELPPCNAEDYDYEGAYRAAAAAVGEDTNGVKMFVYMSACAARLFDTYRERGIGEDVFYATMRFLSRFFASDTQKYAAPRFTWGWWFPRQLALHEFRRGALEYEMTREGTIFIHIPADADLSEEAVDASIGAARAFFPKHFPAFKDADYMCESWMLSPALAVLLPASSHVLRFGQRFDVLEHDETSPAALDWIFPDPALPKEDLPENTSLQRNTKALLLRGGNIGWTTGKLR